MAARRIIIDCDPGVDDAMAILLALASPELDVMALTPVAGNVGLDHTKINALKICELAGWPDIPVYAGCDRHERQRTGVHDGTGARRGLTRPGRPFSARLRAPLRSNAPCHPAEP